jgi:hypothetical protein
MTDERAGCPGCSSQSKEYAREGWAGKHYLRALKWAWEYRLRWRFVVKIEQKRCPFCDVGFFVPGHTVGVLKCTHCESYVLDGRPSTPRRIV